MNQLSWQGNHFKPPIKIHVVDVPPLEMVDNILTVQKCGVAAETINSEVNAFIAQKKLTLGQNKCVKIHIGKKCGDCDKICVHNEEMKESPQVT